MGLRTTVSHRHTKKYITWSIQECSTCIFLFSFFYFSRLVNWPFFPTVQANALSKWNLCLCVKNHVPQIRSHDFWCYINFCLCVCMHVRNSSPEKDQRALWNRRRCILLQRLVCPSVAIAARYPGNQTSPASRLFSAAAANFINTSLSTWCYLKANNIDSTASTINDYVFLIYITITRYQPRAAGQYDPADGSPI